MRTVFVWIICGIMGLTLFHYGNTDTPLNRCIALYINNPEFDDPRVKAELIAVAKKKGVYSIQELVELRCKNWIKHGQKF